MTPPRSEGFVRMPDAEFEAILTRAAEEGAKRALADVGLDGDEAALDIRGLRSLVDCIRLVHHTAMQAAVRMITTGFMLALLAGIAVKLECLFPLRLPRMLALRELGWADSDSPPKHITKRTGGLVAEVERNVANFPACRQLRDCVKDSSMLQPSCGWHTSFTDE